VVNFAFAAIVNFFTGIFQAPAQVNFFHVRKKSWFQPTESMKFMARTNIQAPVAQKISSSIVVLIYIFFQRIENAATAKGYPKLSICRHRRRHIPAFPVHDRL
jgi:hypothetical protein